MLTPIRASATAGLDQVGVTSPKPTGKIPRMPGHQAAFPGKPTLLRSPPSIHGKVQTVLVPRKCLAALWTHNCKL